ncbi:MAG TPA: hypothetical protein VGT00_00985 [Methylomirabilota bacterium]|jgi:hypothetical protein|nr:hypothetical protein [Methylomirabilota bacterium]
MNQVTREYHYRVDREGRIYHDGTEIVDPATLRFFLLALTRTPEGRWLAVCQGERNWFESEGRRPEDTPFIVQRLRLTVESGRLRAVELCLAGDYREPLDPATLEQDGERLFCAVRRGAFRARFGHRAMQQLAPYLSEGPDGPALALDGRRHALPRAASATPRPRT